MGVSPPGDPGLPATLPPAYPVLTSPFPAILPTPPICNLASSRWVPRCPDQVADRGSDATLGQGPRIRKRSEASPLLALFGVKHCLVVLRPVLPAPPRTEVTGGDPLHRSRPGDAARRLRPSLRNAQVCPSAIFFLPTTLPPAPRLPLVLRPSQMPPFGLLRCREALSLLRSPSLGTLNFNFCIPPHRFLVRDCGSGVFATTAANATIAKVLLTRGGCSVGGFSLLLYPSLPPPRRSLVLLRRTITPLAVMWGLP